MKKVKVKPRYRFWALIAAVFILGCALIIPACSAAAAPPSDESLYEFEYYDVEYDISSDCSIAVTEVINVHYSGKKSTGFLRNIPVGSGTQVKNVGVDGVRLLSGETDVPYSVSVEDKSFVTISIGSTENKAGENEIYRITYDYFLGNRHLNDGALSIHPIGFENGCVIKNATVTLIMPDGYKTAARYVGQEGSEEYDTDFTVLTENGKKVLKTKAENLNEHEGIAFDITFTEGSIHPYFDITPYYFVIAAAGLLIVLLLLKITLFNRTVIKPIVNFEAPEGMDPLLMGKLIDNKVSAEDVTALIFYWADKGYIKIDLGDKNNPLLVRIKNLPATAKKYEKVVFAGLFKDGDAVKTGDLKHVFYCTYEKAKAIANDSAKGLYKSWSIGVSILFALTGGVLFGLAPLILGLTAISAHIVYLYGFIAIIPALVLYGLSESIKYYRLKNKAGKNALYICLMAIGILLCAGVFTLIVPSSLIATIPTFLLGVLSFAIAATSVMLISRTPEYNQQLSLIVGFRNFIKCAEKDKLEAILESDPQYYYHVLPYAQVLRLCDTWEEKFEGITVAPPAWATDPSVDMIPDFTALNSLLRQSMRSIASGMISRHPSSGHNQSH